MREFLAMRACCLGLLALLSAATFTHAADPPFPESMVVLRAQPSVFVVQTYADVILDIPEEVSLNEEALVADLATVKVPQGEVFSDGDRYWNLIGQNPEKYLVASPKLHRFQVENGRVMWGTAFAVSREGIFLTNAHVVEGNIPGARLEPSNWLLLDDLIALHVKVLTKRIGGTNRPDGELMKIRDALMLWYAPRSKLIESKFRGVSIVLDYKVDSTKAFNTLKTKGLAAAFAATREEILVPATIVAVGESAPGKDIAVLKAIFDPAEQARLERMNQQRPNPALKAMLADIQNDRVICLPLGNSNDVLPQAKVQALGMPGNAFDARLMDTETQYKVSARDGQIGQTKRMLGSGGWDAFEMTAPIDHGDSGGPVLDTQGNVIAINMAAANDTRNPLRLVVPINLAKELLAKAGITPNPGKLSALWEQGLRLYAEGKYEASLEQILAVKRLQEGNALSGREASWYVKDMAGRCLQKLGKIPGGK